MHCAMYAMFRAVLKMLTRLDAWPTRVRAVPMWARAWLLDILCVFKILFVHFGFAQLMTPVRVPSNV